jgi:HAD superfamily phosphatase (TIGR01668 family)
VILRWLVPYRYARSIAGIDPLSLRADGIRGVILDLDNTIVAWNAPAPTSEVQQWVTELAKSGVKVCIVSNNFSNRVRAIAQRLGVPVVTGAIKPTPWAFRKAMRVMGTEPKDTALVGDQLFTDVLGGNLLGLKTILVDPLSIREFPTTMLVRRVERLVRQRVLKRLSSS